MKKTTILRSLERLRYRVSLETIQILTYVSEHPNDAHQLIVFDKVSRQSIEMRRSEWNRLPVDFDLALRHQIHLLEQKLKQVKGLQEPRAMPKIGARIRSLQAARLTPQV